VGRPGAELGAMPLPIATEVGFSIRLKLNAAGFHARNCPAGPVVIATLPLASEPLDRATSVPLFAPPRI
jgi:hypothetical protein